MRMLAAITFLAVAALLAGTSVAEQPSTENTDDIVYKLKHPERPATVAPPVAIDTSSYQLTSESFKLIASRALLQRGWSLEPSDAARVQGMYERRNLVYRVSLEMQPGKIIIAFVPGYHSDRSNYLHNIEKDILIELQLSRIQQK